MTLNLFKSIALELISGWDGMVAFCKVDSKSKCKDKVIKQAAEGLLAMHFLLTGGRYL